MPAICAPVSLSRVRTGAFLLLGLVLLFAGAKPVLYDTLDPDLFWHLRTAEQLLHDGIAPLNDQFSFASVKEPWVPYSWLGELMLRKIWLLDGLRGAVLGAAIMMAAYLGFIALAAQEARRCASADSPAPSRLAVIVVTAVSGVLTLPYLSFRPVTMAFVILAACAFLLMRDRRLGERSAAVFLAVPLTALLVNIHLLAMMVPGWIGCLAIGALVEWRWRPAGDQTVNPVEMRRRMVRYSLLLFTTGMAMLCTPMLGGVVRTLVHFGKGDTLVGTIISETAPFWTGAAGKLSLTLVIGALACVLMRWQRLRIGETLWLLVGTIALLRMGRFAPIFAISAAPALALTMPKLSDRILGNRPLITLVGCILVVGMIRVVGELPDSRTDMGTWLNRHGPDAPGYPSLAADYVAANVVPHTRHLINEFSWGGYLGWRLGDHYRVLLDERTQLYCPQFWHAVYLDGPAARAAYLATVDADAAILPARKSIFRQHLLQLGWRIAYQDDRAQVLLPPESPAANSGF